MSAGGKGSRPRPFSVSHKKFAENWDRIFGNKNEDSTSSETDKTSQTSKTDEADKSS